MNNDLFKTPCTRKNEDNVLNPVIEFYCKNVLHTSNQFSIKTVNHILYLLECSLLSQTKYPFFRFKSFMSSGSSSEGLRVQESDDFDVLVLFDIVNDHDASMLTGISTEFNPENSDIPTGWAELVMDDSSDVEAFIANMSPEQFKHTFKENKICYEGLRDRVFRSLLDHELHLLSEKMKQYGSQFDITLRKKGPAISLYVKYNGGHIPFDPYEAAACFSRIKIDIVPTIEIQFHGRET